MQIVVEGRYKQFSNDYGKLLVLVCMMDCLVEKVEGQRLIWNELVEIGGIERFR